MLPAFYSGEEVRHVTARFVLGCALAFHSKLTLLTLVDLESGAVQGHPAIAAVKEISHHVPAADLQVAFAARQYPAHFEHDFRIAVIEGGDLRVWCLLVIVIGVLAA